MLRILEKLTMFRAVERGGEPVIFTGAQDLMGAQKS
jgi:hypothetical protein